MTLIRRFLFLGVYITTIFFFNCSKPIYNDWDFYYEGLIELSIEDSVETAFGIDPNVQNSEIIDSLAIEIDIEHDNPSSLSIKLLRIIDPFNTDTLVLWNHNYPGGIQMIYINDFNSEPVNATWSVKVLDEVIDGIEGWWQKCSFMFKYK